MEYFSLESLDRSIYENLRRALLAKGYVPDLRTLDSDAYETAVAALKAQNTYVTLHGTGFAESRDKKESNTIVINRKNIEPDRLGGNAIEYEKTGNTFNKYRTPDFSAMVYYEIRVITTEAKWERELISLVLSVLGHNKSIPMVEEGGIEFDRFASIENGGGVEVGNTEFMEYMFKYYYRDVWLVSGRQLLQENVPELTEITIKPKLAGEDSNALAVTLN